MTPFGPIHTLIHFVTGTMALYIGFGMEKSYARRMAQLFGAFFLLHACAEVVGAGYLFGTASEVVTTIAHFVFGGFGLWVGWRKT